MKYEAVVFDLDGTLTDTLSDLKNSVNYALSEFGFPERSLDEVRCFVGNGVRRLMYLSVPDGTPQTTAEDCLAVFKKHYKENSLVETKPYDGIMPMLNELKRRGVKTAVVTNKMQEAAADIENVWKDIKNELYYGLTYEEIASFQKTFRKICKNIEHFMI